MSDDVAADKGIMKPGPEGAEPKKRPQGSRVEVFGRACRAVPRKEKPAAAPVGDEGRIRADERSDQPV